MLGKRKILYLFLVAVLILSLIPLSIFAQEGSNDSGGSESGGNEKPYINVTSVDAEEILEYQWTLNGSFTHWQSIDEDFYTDLEVEGNREATKDELTIEVTAELSLDASDKLVIQLGYSIDEENFIVLKEFKDIIYTTLSEDLEEETETICLDFSCEDLDREYLDEVEKLRLLVPYEVSNGKIGYEFDTHGLNLEKNETNKDAFVTSDVVAVSTTYEAECLPATEEWIFNDDFLLEFNVQIENPDNIEGQEVLFTVFGEEIHETVLEELIIEFPIFEDGNPGQGNDGQQGNPNPGQGNEEESGKDDPGQGNDEENPGQGNEDPGQGNEGNQGEENNSLEEFIKDEIIPEGMVGLFGLWLPPTEDNFILDKSCSQIRFWVMEQLMYPKIWIFEEEDIELTTVGAIIFQNNPVLEIGTSEFKTSTGNGKHSKSNFENGEGGYYKYNLKGRNCPTLTEGRYILMIVEDNLPVYFSEGVPAILHFRVLDNLQIEIKYRNQTDNTDARRTNIGSNR